MTELRGRLAWIAPPSFFLLAFYLVPLLYLVVYALGAADSRGLLPLLQEIFASPYHRRRVAFTYVQAIGSTLLTLALGIPLAYLFATKRIRGRSLLQALLIVPFVMPALVVALAFQAFLGPAGPVAAMLRTSPIDAIGPVAAILLAHTFYNVGLVARLVGGFWARVPPELVDSARSLGAGRLGAFLRIMLPIGLPAILSTGALVFLFCASSFSLILILGSNQVGTIETLIAEEGTGFRPEYDLAAALGLLQLLTALAALTLYRVMERRASTYYRPRVEAPRDPMPPWGWALLGAALVLVLGPLLSLLHAAIRYDGAYSLRGFGFLVGGPVPLGTYGSASVFLNSLRFGLLAILIGVPLAFALAAAFRRASPRLALVESLFLTPLGSSAVLLGLGFLLAFDGDPLLDLRASPVRIALAHALVAFPFASRILAPSLDSLDPSLRDAARTLGASRFQALWRVEVPLLRPALAAAAVFAFAASLGEFGATFLLRRPEYTTIPLAIYDAFGRPGEVYRAQAEALSVLLLVVAFAAFALIERVRVRQRGAPP